MRFLSDLLCTKEAIQFFNETSDGQDLLKVCTGIKQPRKVWDSIKDTLTRAEPKKIAHATQEVTQNAHDGFLRMVWGPDRNLAVIYNNLKLILNSEILAAAELAETQVAADKLSSGWG